MKPLLSAALALFGALAGAAAGPAAAQDPFPSKPIRIVIPFGPGGATDFVARLVAEKARHALGQNVVVDNKPGANGIIAIEDMARAKPDGYTLMIGNVTTNAITPVLYQSKMATNYERDVIAIARLMVTPNVMIATAKDFGPKTFKEFVDHARANPGKVRYGTNGIGSFLHFDNEMLSRRLGLTMNHIPYKGAGDIMKGLLSGEIHLALLSTPITIPQAQAGTVHVLANVLRRIDQFRDVPTLAELGVPGVGTDNWQAVFAPAGTPPEIVERLHRVLTDAVKDPAIVEAAAKTGTFLFTAETVAETQAWLRAEMAKWRGIAKEVNLDLK